MELQTYLKSGNLELYVLDLLDEPERLEVQRMVLRYPVLQKEIEKIELALESYARTGAVEPSAALEEKIERAVIRANGSQEMSINELVLIGKDSDYKAWLRMVSDYFPDALTAANFCEVIREVDGVKQILMVSSVNIAEETHHNVHESFLILKGKCRCTVGADVFYLDAGGFAQVPLHEHHQVEVVTAPVMAIVQYVL